MSTTFNISNGSKCIEYKINEDQNILSLKDNIIRDFSLDTKYIDLNFMLDRPIRCLGKFNLEPGNFPRTLDMYPLNRFDLNDRTINATFTCIDDYIPFKKSDKVLKISRYNETVNKDESIKEDNIEFNIHSFDDFPPLG